MLKKIFKYSVGSVFVFTLVFTVYTALTLLLFKFIDPPTTAFIQQNNSNSLEKTISTDSVSQSWISIKSISDNIIFTVIASEDQRFIDHFGIDLVEVEKIIDETIDGESTRGASTITQQVAKNLFLFPHKLFIRKGIEAYYSLIIELLWSKKRILEVYLNTAQFGKQIFGVEAASNFYFNKPAQYLSLHEAAQLTAILPNPVRLNLKKKSRYLNNRIARIEKGINYINTSEIIKKVKE
ncbi:MAG: monofunctional biosynthetic peptidoglycan transglycosylase [Melioribacteraceae bacterium]|nr:monofunctional biosynthetic peptidoglycan transglycosylase [Melioribacteraceae bacterium]